MKGEGWVQCAGWWGRGCEVAESLSEPRPSHRKQRGLLFTAHFVLQSRPLTAKPTSYPLIGRTPWARSSPGEMGGRSNSRRFNGLRLHVSQASCVSGRPEFHVLLWPF